MTDDTIQKTLGDVYDPTNEWPAYPWKRIDSSATRNAEWENEETGTRVRLSKRYRDDNDLIEISSTGRKGEKLTEIGYQYSTSVKKAEKWLQDHPDL